MPAESGFGCLPMVSACIRCPRSSSLPSDTNDHALTCKYAKGKSLASCVCAGQASWGFKSEEAPHAPHWCWPVTAIACMPLVDSERVRIYGMPHGPRASLAQGVAGEDAVGLAVVSGEPAGAGEAPPVGDRGDGLVRGAAGDAV